MRKGAQIQVPQGTATGRWGEAAVRVVKVVLAVALTVMLILSVVALIASLALKTAGGSPSPPTDCPYTDTDKLQQLIIDGPVRKEWRASEQVPDDSNIKSNVIQSLGQSFAPYFTVDDVQVTAPNDVTREINMNCSGDNKRCEVCVVEPFTGTIDFSDAVNGSTCDTTAWCAAGGEDCLVTDTAICANIGADGIPGQNCLPPDTAHAANTSDGEFVLDKKWVVDDGGGGGGRCLKKNGTEATSEDGRALGQTQCTPTTISAPAVGETPADRDYFRVVKKCEAGYSSKNPPVDENGQPIYYLEATCGANDWHYSFAEDETCDQKCLGFDNDAYIGLFASEGIEIIDDHPQHNTNVHGFNVRYRCAEGWGPRDGETPADGWPASCVASQDPHTPPIAHFPTDCVPDCTPQLSAIYLSTNGIQSQFSTFGGGDPNYSSAHFDVSYTCMPGWNHQDTELPPNPVSRRVAYDGTELGPAPQKKRATKCEPHRRRSVAPGLRVVENSWEPSEIGLEPCVRDCLPPQDFPKYTIDEDNSIFRRSDFYLHDLGCAPGFAEVGTGFLYRRCNEVPTSTRIDEQTEFTIGNTDPEWTSGCEQACVEPALADQVYELNQVTLSPDPDRFLVEATCLHPESSNPHRSPPQAHACFLSHPGEPPRHYEVTGCYPQCPQGNHCSNGTIKIDQFGNTKPPPPQLTQSEINEQKRHFIEAMNRNIARDRDLSADDITYFKIAYVRTPGNPEKYDKITEYQIKCAEEDNCDFVFEDAPAATPKDYTLNDVTWSLSQSIIDAVLCVPNREHILSTYTDNKGSPPGSWDLNNISELTQLETRICSSRITPGNEDLYRGGGDPEYCEDPIPISSFWPVTSVINGVGIWPGNGAEWGEVQELRDMCIPKIP